MQNSIYKIKYLLFLSWDWEAWCLTQSGGNPPPPERNTAWNKGRKCFHCLGAPNNLIRPWPYPEHFTLGKEFRYRLYRMLGVPWGQSWRCTENLSRTAVRTPNRSTRTELLYRPRYRGRVIESLLVEIMNRNRYPVSSIIKPLNSTSYYTIH